MYIYIHTRITGTNFRSGVTYILDFRSIVSKMEKGKKKKLCERFVELSYFPKFYQYHGTFSFI